MFKILNCLKCSAPLKDGAKFCGKCGEPVPIGLDFDRDEGAEKPKKYILRNPRNLQRSKLPGKTKVAVTLFVFLPIAVLLFYANHFYESSLAQDDETRILLLKQHLTKLNENEHRARIDIYRRLMELDGNNKEYMMKFDFHRSQIAAMERKKTKRKKKKPRPNMQALVVWSKK